MGEDDFVEYLVVSFDGEGARLRVRVCSQKVGANFVRVVSRFIAVMVGVCWSRIFCMRRACAADLLFPADCRRMMVPV